MQQEFVLGYYVDRLVLSRMPRLTIMARFMTFSRHYIGIIHGDFHYIRFVTNHL